MSSLGINIIGLVLNISIIFLAKFNNYMTKHKKRIFTILASLMLAITIFASFETLFKDSMTTASIVYLNIMQGVIFCLTPTLPLFIASCYIQLDKKKAWIIIPFVINIIFNVISMFTLCVYHYYPDPNRYYVHGPFYWVPIAVALYSLTLAILFSVIDINYGSRLELIFVVMIFVISGLSFVFQFVLETEYLFYNMVSVCITLFFTIVSLLEVRKDILAQTYNRAYFDSYMDTIEGSTNAIIVMYDLNDLKKTNDTLGHNYGDRMIADTGKCLNYVYGKIGKVFRYGGDEFFIIITDMNKYDEIEKYKERLKQLLDKFELSAACGYIKYDKSEKLEDVLNQVDEMMYENKKIIKGLNN